MRDPRDGCWGVRDPWILRDMGGFLLLLGPFVIKAKPNECLRLSQGRPLALPPQPQFIPGGSSSAPQPDNSTGALPAPSGPLALPSSFQNPMDASAHPWGGLALPQPRYFGWYLGGVWVPPGPLGRCGVVWRCHLGVLLTAVLRGGRRRAGGGPGLHPKAAVVGAARAAPAKGREPIGELRHRKGASPVPTSTLLHPYLWGWGSSHLLLESEGTL